MSASDMEEPDLHFCLLLALSLSSSVFLPLSPATKMAGEKAGVAETWGKR